MPELPDLECYLLALRRMIDGQRLENITIRSPFVLRTFDPPIDALIGLPVEGISRQGKRIIWQFPDELYLVVHLMIAGRFHWRKGAATAKGKNDLAAFRFAEGTLLLTEASQKKRASLHVYRGLANVEAQDRGGLEPLNCTLSQFEEALQRENHTLKRSLADPRLFSGIGNAYSDEILHAARLSRSSGLCV
ncbi:DNA-formamidopyrimidine glycosylase family protein [Anatilimnocola floriformis]|uniref:DNA-formamidopyrimidine glycosylase family protein n=1 Tax=Anatilimnocola floriformis TaxID=2948575 RepID=UPI0020C348AE|nr:DNA-formamidopyrimidine glycosylase family protein [Anatilimnocola floriformis]